MFVSDLRKVCAFLRVLQFPPQRNTITLTLTHGLQFTLVLKKRRMILALFNVVFNSAYNHIIAGQELRSASHPGVLQVFWFSSPIKLNATI